MRKLRKQWGFSVAAGGAFIGLAASPEIGINVTSVIGDHAVTMTIDFFPLALTTVPAQNFRLFWVLKVV